MAKASKKVTKKAASKEAAAAKAEKEKAKQEAELNERVEMVGACGRVRVKRRNVGQYRSRGFVTLEEHLDAAKKAGKGD